MIFQYLWSNRLQANPHYNITVYDINFNKPCTIKSKMNIYIGKNYKNYTFLVSGSDICLWEGHEVSQKYFRKQNKTKKERLGQRKLILAAS